MPLTDSRPIWDMPLNEILSQSAPEGTRASATDIPGVVLEWKTTEAYPSGAWFGTVGNLTQAQLNALPPAFLATGTRATVGTSEYSWSESAWEEVGGGGPATSTTLGSVIPDDSAFFVDGTGRLSARENYGQEFHAFDVSSLPDSGPYDNGDIVPALFGEGLLPYSQVGSSHHTGVNIVNGALEVSVPHTASTVSVVYMDLKKHTNNITEIGCTYRFETSIGVIAWPLWAGYSSNTAFSGVHLALDPNGGLSLTTYPSGALGFYKSFKTALNVNHTMRMVFNASNQLSVYIDGELMLTAYDPNYNSLPRKVACFEIFERADSGTGKIKIISGYSKSAPPYMLPQSPTPGSKIYKSIAVASPRVLTGSAFPLMSAIPVVARQAKVTVRCGLDQTVAGKVWLTFGVTPVGESTPSTKHYVLSKDVVSGIITAVFYVKGIGLGTMDMKIVTDGTAVATLRQTTDYVPFDVFIEPFMEQ